jgi:DNA-binding Lrp family transcriptional regulator
MTRDATDSRLIAALADGLPLDPRPFAALARTAGVDEDEAVARVRRMVGDGVIKRFGLVVRHHELGYCANAMVVWDAPDDRVRIAGRRLARNTEVTLCYRRARHTGWPYNLYLMIHGRDRAAVLATVGRIEAEAGLGGLPRRVLFSRRRFKQTGARYRTSEVA